MKILKRGKSKEFVDSSPLHLTCKRCETEIETSMGEMALQTSDIFGDYYEIKCPVCERMIQFDDRAKSSQPVSTAVA